MPITLNHSNINVQYSSDKSYIIETVKSDLYRRNENVDTVIRNNIQAAPVTPTTYVDSSGNVYAVESYTYSGTANTADYTRVFTKNTTCDILIVGGGGGGGPGHGGGGGAGQLILIHQATLNGTYTINVGKGGIGGRSSELANSFPATKGSDSVFGTVIAEGGGANTNVSSDKNGGSGAGGDGYNTDGGTSGFGNKNTTIDSFPGAVLYSRGNNGGSNTGSTGGGGGGAGTAGAVGSTTSPFSIGGDGLSGISDINYDFKTNFGNYGKLESDGKYWFAGGGGGGASSTSAFGGKGGGGDGSNNSAVVGNAMNNTGSGGGGGAGGSGSGGSGGSGIVIIKYLLGTIPTTNFLTNEPVVTAPIFTETIRTFVHSGGTEAQTTYNITVPQNTICDILIVGGGGAGGNDRGGGGGAGGVIYSQNIILNGGTYTINVGKEGIGSTSGASGGTGTRGTNGGNSSISGPNLATLTAIGGGAGGSCASGGIRDGLSGGSGGGGSQYGGNGSGGSGTSGQGNNGGTGIEYGAAGGGGGYTTAGGNASSTQAGNGGQGFTNSITGTTVIYSAGGGGGASGGAGTGLGQQTAGSGGSSGAGNGGLNNSNGSNATVFGCGGGGGGSSVSATTKGGNGGSGIVIIKFKSITNAAVSEGTPATTHKRLNFTYVPNYPIIQADTTNLKAWYKFDGNYNDSSSSGFNLTNSGAEIVDGLIEESVSTNGSDFLQTSGINLNGKTYSISFWAKFNTAPTASSFLFSQGITGSNGLILAFLYESVGNVLRFSHFGNGNDMDTTGYNMTNVIGTSWHHYAVTYNNTNRGAEIWFDGVKLNTNISTLTNTFSGSGSFTIARSITHGGTLNGLMEDFRYYDKILTSAEISQLYNIPSTNQYTLNFPVPTLTDINNNSNIVLNGAYDISLNTSNALIIPKNNQYIPKPTEFTTSNLSLRYNILNPILDPVGAQWTYSSNNTNVYNIGSVGIGTSNPQYSLDINGTLNAKEYFYNGLQIGRLSEGMVANVQHLTYTHMEVKNNTGWDAINDDLATGFVISITPKSNLSKILVNLVAHIGLTNANDGRWWGFKLYRKIGTAGWAEVTGPNGTETGASANTAGTPVWISNNMGTVGSYNERIINLTGTYLDSPNTTSIVYYTAYWNQRMADNPSRTGELWLNRAGTQNDAYRPAPSSSWTLKEIWYG